MSVYKHFIIIIGGRRLTERTFPLAMNLLKSHPLAVIGIFHTFGAKIICVGEELHNRRKFEINGRGTGSLDGIKPTVQLEMLHDERKPLDLFSEFKMYLIS